MSRKIFLEKLKLNLEKVGFWTKNDIEFSLSSNFHDFNFKVSQKNKSLYLKIIEVLTKSRLNTFGRNRTWFIGNEELSGTS